MFGHACKSGIAFVDVFFDPLYFKNEDSVREVLTKPHMLYDFLLMFVCCLKIEFGADLPRGMAVFAFQLSPLLKRLWKNIACHGFQKQGFCVGGPCQTVLRRCLHSSMCHMNGIIEVKSGFWGPDQKKKLVFGFATTWLI